MRPFEGRGSFFHQSCPTENAQRPIFAALTTGVCEGCTVFDQLIHTGRFDDFIAQGMYIKIAVVVGENDEDVGFTCCGLRSKGKGCVEA